MVEGLGDDYEVRTRESLLAGALHSTLLSPPGELHYSNVVTSWVSNSSQAPGWNLEDLEHDPTLGMLERTRAER